jgi:starch phosphorylase
VRIRRGAETRVPPPPGETLGVALDPETVRRDLESLAANLWWSWCPEAAALWSRVAAGFQGSRRADLPRNPVRLVRALDPKRVAALAADPEYALHHSRVQRLFARAMGERPAPEGLSKDSPIAYFSMEFGVHESLPVYAGGLGILAGDHAKAASDGAVPLVGVGLFYHSGYFRQEIDGRGRHRVTYPRARLKDLPLRTVSRPGGEDLLIPIELPGRKVRARVWRASVGRVSLLLLDADVPGNRPEDRKITNRLYGGTREDRIRQEIIAGIGGVRALGALGIRPGAWHLNEGHVAFLTLERLRELRERAGLGAREAMEAIAASTVFTTHTPVPEGNEVFDVALARRYLEQHARAAGIDIDDYLALGLDHGPDGRPVLSLTVLALRLSRHRNGVSRLHGEVSRRMWARLWPGFRAEDVPIGHVTNGIHTSSWVAPGMDDLLRNAVAPDWPDRLDEPELWKRTSRLDEADLFRVKQKLKSDLVTFVRNREDTRLARSGWASGRRKRAVETLLDPEVFTIGFARRFALYKRSALIFRDIDRARRLFASRARPVQIVFAGKPHPEDGRGQEVFNEISAMARRKGFTGKVALIENYDVEAARFLVQGCDLWLNTPRRPLEASGTSGQKVPVNAGLNLSILDGWWPEGYTERTGWAIGKPVEYADRDLQDAEDAESLYRILEREVLPLYYRRDRDGVPAAWFRKVKRSMAALVPEFSTAHMIGEYTRKLYRPAVEGGRRMLASGARAARELAEWKAAVARSWPLVHARSVTRRGRRVVVELYHGAIPPGRFAWVDARGVDRPCRLIDVLGPGVAAIELVDAPGGTRGSEARIYPTHPAMADPREMGLAVTVRA